MNVRKTPLSAIRHLHAELDRFEKQAQEEIKDQRSHALGILRLDLIEECRRRLIFISYMVKDAEERDKETRRSNQFDQSDGSSA
ncbi:MAG: hypothetical protein JWO91_578 [Acidobacteriaceae bacterium]|nr:hypothetical protein [Acidobacteriaceae bacterium]